MDHRVWLLLALAGAAALVVALLPPTAQDPAYHRFADGRVVLGIPNGLNVLSNLPFALVGALGLLTARRRPGGGGPFIDARERWPWIVVFLGLVLTALGSAYYHLAPDNGRLLWDRLPLAAVFMALVAAVIAERISLAAGHLLLAPLVAVGIGSVLHWHLGEMRGAGDLRVYAAVQFFPMLAIPVMLLRFPPRYTRAGDLGWVVALYGLAKAFEALDGPIFALGAVVSGHALKHVTAGIAAYWLVRMLDRRRPAGLPAGRWDPAGAAPPAAMTPGARGTREAG